MPLRRHSSIRQHLLLFAAACLSLAACGSSGNVDDPELRQIQDMVDEQLPVGSPSSMVYQFANTRGYRVESAGRSDAMVVIIRHIDPQAVKPVTARVTFHFDATNKLVKTDTVRTFNEPVPPAQAEPQPDRPPQSSPETTTQPPQ